MLWVNGYSGAFARTINLAPFPGRPYWGKNINAAGYLLKDWNWMFIDPDHGFLNTPSARFKAGYLFAIEHEKSIKNNILLSGNILQIVAHGTGVAFAEGIASYLYEEKGIITDLAVYIQGTNLSATPQSKRAVDCRIVTSRKGDFLRNRNGSLRFKDVVIVESKLNNGFSKYSVCLDSKDTGDKTSNLYFRNSRADKIRLNRHFKRPYALWSAIDLGLKMFIENEIDALTSKVENVRDVVYEKFSMN